MAALGSQSIASSYEQLLHVDADGGGNSTTHVSVKDGDNDTTFGFTIASDALMMTSTNRLEFGDTGTYIHQSADGVLDLVSDTEIEINATTVDMNGALDLDGTFTQDAGAVVFNEAGADYDFRIEGVGEANALFVQGSNGFVGIGDSTPNARLDVEGDSADYLVKLDNGLSTSNANRYGIYIMAGADDSSGTTYYLNCADGNGDEVGYIANTSGTFALTDGSDRRIKDNIRDTSVEGLTSVNQIKVRDFELKKSGISKTGFIAQELKLIYPAAVVGSENDVDEDGNPIYMGVSRDVLVPVLVKAIQELSAKVEALEG